MARWIDSHCHIQHMDEPLGVLARSPDIALFVAVGVDAASSAAADDLSAASDGRVLATAGLHPDHAARWPAEGERIAKLAEATLAVGETGLDFYRNLAPRHLQLRAFREQLDLAVRLDKPVVVHCRDAFREVYETLERSGAGDRAILHCWCGGPKWTQRFLDLGVALSFAGPVMIGTDDMIRRGAALVPPDRTLAESDAPHFCSRRAGKFDGEPSDVALVGAAFALLWGTDCADAARTIGASTTRAYRL